MIRSPWQFLTGAAFTQALLVVQQIVLLPLQLHAWGQGGTAAWNAGLAAAGTVLLADFGLRGVGHASLLRRTADETAQAVNEVRVDTVWGLARCASLVVALLLGLVQSAWVHGPADAWPLVLTAAIWLELLLIVRASFLDTTGRLLTAELPYTGMLSLRLAASCCALWVFHAGPMMVAAIQLAASAVALALQGWLCRDLPALGLFATVERRGRGAVLRMLPSAFAEPLSQWCRTSLPVLVLASIAAPAVVNTFLLLRAIFGLFRQLIAQLARYVAVHAAHRETSGGIGLAGADQARPAAWSRLLLGVNGAACVLACAVLTDNLRLLGRLMPGLDVPSYRLVAACLGVSAVIGGYQFVQALWIRRGWTHRIAMRQGLFLSAAALAAAIGVATRSVALYVVFIALADLVLGWAFLRDGAKRSLGSRLLGPAIAASAIVGYAAIVVHAPGVFEARDAGHVAIGVLACMAWVLLALGGLVVVDAGARLSSAQMRHRVAP